ncbi:hypothetical protein ACFPN0_04225 [Kitasatospora cinereorecta]
MWTSSYGGGLFVTGMRPSDSARVAKWPACDFAAAMAQHRFGRVRPWSVRVATGSAPGRWRP